jgi:hypothetical protein
MPLFLVRWPWLKASLVSARDEDDLLDTLDQMADSEGATWSVYRGPVWVDFDLPAKYRIDVKEKGVPLRPDELVVADVSRMEIGKFELSAPECDHAAEMDEEITKKAFPHVHEAFWERDDEPTDDDLRLAVKADLEPLMKAEWGHAVRGRRTDRAGALAQLMGAPVRQIENVLRQTGHLEKSSKATKKQARVRKLKKKRQ